MQDLRKSERVECDAVSSGEVVVTSAHQTLDGGAPELPRGDVQAALADFGVPKRSKRAQAEAERRAKKKRQHFVNSARSTSAPKTGRETAIQNLAPETWRPRWPSEMTMDRALREMEFPSRLAGASWVLE